MRGEERRGERERGERERGETVRGMTVKGGLLLLRHVGELYLYEFEHRNS